MILLIDNYDSFSYNVYQLVGSVNPNVRVIRNDEMTVKEIEDLSPSHIILSPGPGRPSAAGICEEVIRYFAGKIPIMGICLGHQAICEVFGAVITYAKELMHGKQSLAALDTESLLFTGMDREITVARYHSLAAEPGSMPEELKVTARTADGEIMAVEHREVPIYGVQFHPESVLTPQGKQIMENFLRKGLSCVSDSIMAGTPEHAAGIEADSATLRAQSEKKVADYTEQNTQAAGSAESATEKRKNMIKEAIIKLSRKEDIGYDMAKSVMNEIMSGEASDVQKSAYLTALSMKGETIEEITGSAEEMRNHSLKLNADREVLEIVGTGGDGSNSFNISTTASLIISAAGVPVAKHGNRAASSKSGAADCLEALGVDITIEPEKSRKVLEEIGICFLFAQKYHTAMRHVGPIRKELGIRTIFNILGPLANPANPAMQVMGVYDEGMLSPMARVLSNLGIKRGMVVYGQDKLDELSVSAPSSVCEINNGEFLSYTINPEELGLGRYPKEELTGGTPQENAEITKRILQGEKGAKRDASVLNAGAALYIAGKAESIYAGVRLAEEIIDSGRAMEQLNRFVELTNR